MGNASTQVLKEKISKVLGHDQWESKELKEDKLFGEKEKITFKCLIHDYYCEKAAHSITRSKNDFVMCPYCQHRANKYISVHLVKNLCTEDNLEYVSLIDVDKNNCLTEYSRISAKTYFYCNCPKHGIFKTCYDLLTHGHKCPKCGRDTVNARLSFQELSTRFSKRNYTLQQVERINGKTHLYYICQKHPTIIQHILLSNFINGCGCRFCAESKGEREIKNYLTDNGIAFEQQKTFSECKYKKELPFDFYLPDYNICIEFQGQQHYGPVRYWNGYNTVEKAEENFQAQQMRDNIKREFCQNNNIKLIEISYKDYKRIKEILQREL